MGCQLSMPAVLSARNGFVAHVLELLAPLGGVSARRMFGGFGIYRDGLMFALVADDVLYLKADGENRDDFEAAGSAPFAYQTRARSTLATRADTRARQSDTPARRTQVVMSYWRAPDEALERADTMATWARSAYSAALRARASSRTAKGPKRVRRAMRRI
jgi:DNA transformation protein